MYLHILVVAIKNFKLLLVDNVTLMCQLEE